MKNTIHCYISGRVQGVCFRMSASQQAKILGIKGWVRNLDDGRVEVMASGEDKLLRDFQKWLARGPSMAKVLNVECTTVDDQGFTGFTIR